MCVLNAIEPLITTITNCHVELAHDDDGDVNDEEQIKERSKKNDKPACIGVQ